MIILLKSLIRRDRFLIFRVLDEKNQSGIFSKKDKLRSFFIELKNLRIDEQKQ